MEPQKVVKPKTSGKEHESVANGPWPNKLPVPKGISEISQDAALFDDDEKAENTEHQGTEMKQAASRGAAAVGSVAGMLTQARATLGLGETPPGSNHNKITVWYNDNIQHIGDGAWCDMAVTYWAAHSSNLAAIYAGPNKGYAYTVAHAQEFESKGHWHGGVAGIKAGDIVFFDWTGTRSIQNIDHVGVVERVQGGNIITIEGNASNTCARMVRNSKYIVGFGRPAYGTSAPPPAKTTVSLSHIVAAAKRDPGLPQGGTTYKADVLPVEAALVKEGLLDAKYSDGSFGSLTVTAYKAWQKQLGYSGKDADGIPGMQSLTKLGEKHGFKVS